MVEGKITISKTKLLKVLESLEIIVVSMDRIGSSISNMSQDEVNKLTIEFLNDWDVFRKLAEARRLLSESFSDELGDDDMDELERAFEN